jgi:PilZ domain
MPGKAAMKDRRTASRQRSFLQGRIFYNNRRSSVDCLIRDISDTGAKLKFSESITVPEAMELYIPNKDEFRRARVQWRFGGEMGIAFGEEGEAPVFAPAPSSDVAARMQKLETEIALLKRLVNELRSDIRKQQGEVA